MVNREVRQILVALLAKARAGQVDWQAADVEVPGVAEDYFVYFPNSAINVWRDTEGRAIAGILNKSGTVVDSVTSSDAEFVSLLDELLTLAKRKVLDVDATLKEIKDALESENEAGAPAQHGTRKAA